MLISNPLKKFLKSTKNFVNQNKFDEHDKSGKGHISVTILQINFFVNFFKTSDWI
jgi:hypothetical protein